MGRKNNRDKAEKTTGFSDKELAKLRKEFIKQPKNSNQNYRPKKSK